MHAGRIDEHDLPGLASLLLRDVDNAEDSVARGLGLRRNNGQFLADQRIQQSTLAGIGAAENADESGMKGHGNRVQASGARCQVSANRRLMAIYYLVPNLWVYPPSPWC